MLVFDQLKKNDPQLRLLALAVFAGFGVLFAGLWWVQVVQARQYQAHLETQSFRTVRIPAARGSILDRHGRVLAENQPDYQVSLYLEDLSERFKQEYRRARPVLNATNAAPFWKRWLGYPAVKTQFVRLKPPQVQSLERQVRYRVTSNVVNQVATILGRPLALNPTNFQQHYETARAFPYPVVTAMDPTQIARFAEQSAFVSAADLEIQATRRYPNGPAAAHVLGYVRRDNSSAEGEDAFFWYRLPDYRGVVGIEGYFDAHLRGRAGAKSVLVNNLGYRQTETTLETAEPGSNVVLTLDLRIQQAAERALRERAGSQARGAVVVMDVHSGDLLALVSSPAADANKFSQAFPTNWNDVRLGLQKNRATQELYQPGSIFKTVIALAALEKDLNPNEEYQVAPNPRNPERGAIFVGSQPFVDTVSPGNYNLRRAIAKSSNAYFITNGLRRGVIEKVVELGQRLHLGERIGLPTMQEAAGIFPTPKRISSNWRSGDTANLCIGQGEMAVTPLQMAVMTSALANGGKVLWPRLVARIEPQDPISPESAVIFPGSRVRDQLGVRERYLNLLRDCMLADTEDPEGTAYPAFRDFGRGTSLVKPMRVCGKTGTAQTKDEHGKLVDHITWFISFAPYEKPRYAVVVMVESGSSGGGTCAPVARDIYSAIQKLDSASDVKSLARTD